MMEEDLALEISMRTNIPMDDVEEVLDEEYAIYEEYEKKRKKKKLIGISIFSVIFMLGAITAAIILDRKQKIDMEEMIKKYTQKIAKKIEERR